MHYLKCNNCGYLNPLNSMYMTFCDSCSKKLENNFNAWQNKNPGKSFDDFKRLICISEEDVKTQPVKKKSKPKSLKYWIGFAAALAIFYAIGQVGGQKIIEVFRKPLYEKALMNEANEINKMCPIMIDNGTRLDNAIAMPNNILQYHYTLINALKDSLNIEELESALTPRITNFVKTNPDMKIMRENKTTVNYYYSDRTGEHLLTISVSPELYSDDVE